jgi:hypothetical protein
MLAQADRMVKMEPKTCNALDGRNGGTCAVEHDYYRVSTEVGVPPSGGSTVSVSATAIVGDLRSAMWHGQETGQETGHSTWTYCLFLTAERDGYNDKAHGRNRGLVHEVS